MTRTSETAGSPARARGGEPLEPRDIGLVRRLLIAHGAFMLILGGLLIFVPGETLTFVAMLAGVALLAFGLIDLLWGLFRSSRASERAAQILLALLAVAAGIVVVIRPDGSVKAVAVAAGLYLLVTGVARAVLGAPGISRGTAIVSGGAGAIAGAALIAWPGPSAGVVAVLFGAFLAVAGATELLFGLRLGRAGGDPAPGEDAP